MVKFLTARFISLLLVLFLLVLMGGPIAPAYAATTPSLGAAGTFGVLAGTFTPNGASTTITGDLGYTTLNAGLYTVVGGTDFGPGAPTPTARTDANTALTNLNNQACTSLGVIVALNAVTISGFPTGTFPPGCYSSSGAMSITLGTTVTLSGAGTYIFRPDGAFTTGANSIVALANGASSCNVFWTPTAATTLGGTTTFIGTIIDNANAITVGTTTTWRGRALSLGAGVVTVNTDTINSTCVTAAIVPSSTPIWNTITVIKQVINDNGGTALFSDFPLFVNGNPVSSGQSITSAPGIYTVTETNRPGYTTTFTGHCNASGVINHGGINTFNSICTVVNNDIGAPPVPPVPPLIDVVKVPSPLSLPVGPGSVTYTYTLTNIGTVPVTNVTMVGDTCSPIILVSGDTNGDLKLDVNERWIHRCTTTLSATHTNTVVATGFANGLTAVDVASSTVVVGLPIVPPLIHVVKVPSPLTLPAGAGTVTYRYTVTNPGTAPLSNVSIVDDKCTGLPGRVIGHPGDLNKNDLLESNESWSFICNSNLTATTTNTATASGTANGLIATDFALATVVVAAPIILPATGMGPNDNNIPDDNNIRRNRNIGVLVIMFASLSLLYATRRKQTN